MKDNDSVMSKRVTRPKLYDEAFHFRALRGTKKRMDRLRGETSQAEFIRTLVEQGIENLEDEQLRPKRR